MRAKQRIIVKLCSTFLISFMLAGCSADSGAKLEPPAGWTKESVQAPVQGPRLLFAGKRDEGTPSERHLVVVHIPEMKSKQDARGIISAHLNAFKERDAKLFLAISVREIAAQGRHPLCIRFSGRSMGATQSGKLEVYFFMTDAGLYQVSHSSESDATFDIDEFLRDSFSIRAQEASFTREVTAEFVKELPEMQQQERQRMGETNSTTVK